MNKDSIKTILTDKFKPIHLEVIDESHLHAQHVKKQLALTQYELDQDLREEMANTFEVSTIAMTYRLQSLGFERL